MSSGARYWRADLQVHTPRDGRWPGAEPRDPQERRALARTYLQAAADRGIQVVGITEHHDVSWIDDLRAVAGAVGVVVLPGFEVETAEGIHVLCLFEPKTPVDALEDALTVLGFDRAKRQSTKLTEIRSTFDFRALIDEVQGKRNGICIAAHVLSDKGVLKHNAGGARADMWCHPGLFAADVPCDPAVYDHEGRRRMLQNEDPNYVRDRAVACVCTSDARSIDVIGTKSVWIKMDRPGVRGLRQAFLDPESRIAFEDPMAGRSTEAILSVTWDGGYLDGASVAFNPELTCLIGGKGTGKSTVIESVRWAFGIEVAGEDADDLRRHVLKPGTTVKVTFKTGGPDPQRRTVERTAPRAPVVRDSVGSPLLDVKPTDLLRPNVYGQKEIYAAAQEDSARLTLLERFATDELRELVGKEHDLLAQLTSSADTLRGLRRNLRQAAEQLAELPALLDWRERFRAAGIADRLAERRRLDRDRDALERADAVLLERSRAVDALVSDAARIPVVVRDGEDPAPWADLLVRADDLLLASDGAWATQTRALGDRLRADRDALAEVRRAFDVRAADRRAAFDQALRDMQSTAPEVDPEKYLDVERRIERLTPLRDVRETLEAQTRERAEQRGALLLDLAKVRDAQHHERRAAAARLTTATRGDVRVTVEFQGDRGALVERIKDRKTGVRADALQRLVDHEKFSPGAFAHAARTATLAAEFGLTDHQAEVLQNTLDEDFLESAEVMDTPDRVVVELDIGEDDVRQYRRVEHLSPGQKSTAILLLILQSDDGPLVIDQPEDDLDNRFIYADVVKRLREAKRRRQIVVATHNANIPVLGDAEQIVVLDSIAGELPRGTVRAHGSIDTREVQRRAEQILEGGHEAFRRRQEKYGC